MAIQRATDHLTKTKNQKEVFQLLGQLYFNVKDYDRAIGSLEKAIAIDPNLLSAYLLIGNAYTAQKKFEPAMVQYQKQIDRNPQAVAPLMMMATLYEYKNQRDKANDYYRKILDIDKKFSPAANNLAWNYAEHGGNLDVALGLAQRAREANPGDPDVADTLGWIYYKKGVYESSLRLLNEANEKLRDSSPTLLYHLGMTYRMIGNNASAREVLSKALAAGKSFPESAEAQRVFDELQSRKPS